MVCITNLVIKKPFSYYSTIPFPDDKFYLLCDKPKYTVGRHKSCDIVGESTQSSLGRFHATLHPYEDRIEIIDTESKYGTYVNEQINSNVKMNPNTAIPLKDGDTVRFGFIDFTWKLEKINIVVLTSTLADKEKENLKKDVSTLGGQFLDEWSDTCTHLVVKNLTLTVKVLQALCHAIPIVKPEYFKVVLASIRSKSRTLPNVESYQPLMVERISGSTVSLQPNIDRKRLFVGKTFIFMNRRHMETFKGIVECAMGQCSSLDTKKWQRRSLTKAGTIVVSNTSSSTQSQVATQTVNELNEFLSSKGSRMIPDSEISLAVLHCSLDKYCNPNHTVKDYFESDSRVVPSMGQLIADTPANQNENITASLTHSINLPETIDQPNALASTVPSNSAVINLMDDDDDVMLVQEVDLAMESMNKGKRKNSTENDQPSVKKPNLAKSADSSVKSNEMFVFSVPQRSTRSSLRNNNCSTTKLPVEKKSETVSVARKQDTELITMPQTEPTPSTSRANSNSQIQGGSSQQEKSSTEISIIEHPASQKRTRTTVNNSHLQCITSTQIESPKRKRIAHRPSTSKFGGCSSDSDDELFKFNNQPSTKKSRPAKDSDSDSDNNMNYPISSGPVAPVSVIRPLTQPSQYGPDTWLSRPTPSQTSSISGSTMRSKKRNPIEKSKSANISAGWQIGKFCISSPPIQIPTHGWCSKDAIKLASFENEMKEENTNGDTVIEDAKWMNSTKCGIQVITKSMNLMSTSGKVFKVSSLTF